MGINAVQDHNKWPNILFYPLSEFSNIKYSFKTDLNELIIMKMHRVTLNWAEILNRFK